MSIEHNKPLAKLTSFGVGGVAEKFVEIHSSSALEELLLSEGKKPDWVLGYGANVLISDKGLPGTTVRIIGGQCQQDGSVLIADAGLEWDQLVEQSTAAGLWGLELMIGIPGGVGAATFINITAYGQSVGDTAIWVDAWDPATNMIKRFDRQQLDWSYKKSIFQEGGIGEGMIILRTAFELSPKQTTELTYQSALDIAEELELDPSTLEGRHQIILTARERAGSLLRRGKEDPKTAGSFFRNPVIDQAQVEQIITHDESGKTAEQIKKMNKVHGGEAQRVSAAHVMLAAGFTRGQSWGDVKLNDQNLLKIENAGKASAQDIYNTAMMIKSTVQQKLGIDLVPEAVILGDFQDQAGAV